MRDVKERTFMIVVLLSVVTLTASSQTPGYQKVADVASFKSEFTTQSANIRSIDASFVQEKTLIALTEKITSTGHFLFKRADRIRIEYKKPFQYLMIMNGDKMLIKDDQKENRVNVKSNRLMQQLNRIIIDCVQGSILDSKNFSSVAFENEKMYRIELTPSSRQLREFFSTIVLEVERKDYSVSTIYLNEPGGDQTKMSFVNKKLNISIPDAEFNL